MNVAPIVAWVARAVISCGLKRACRIAVRMAAYEAMNYLGSFIPDPPENKAILGNHPHRLDDCIRK